MKKVAIIGAGLAGLTLADHIADFAEVTLFEKFYQVSGRMATRHQSPFVFDHGAQFFTVKYPEFDAFVQQLKQAGVANLWHANFVEIDGTQVKKSRHWDDAYPHYVGVPEMSSIGLFMYAQLLQRQVSVHLNTQVARIEKSLNLWQLEDANQASLGAYDWVITAIPAAQATNLMPANFAHYHTIKNIEMQPCYTLLLGFDRPLNINWNAAHVTNSIISWISVNSSKPARNSEFSLVVMSSNQWAFEHFNQTQQWVTDALMTALLGVLGEQVLQASTLHLKKWHYANTQKQMLDEVLLDAEQQLACCGDWCISGRVENAFMSAKQMGECLKRYL